MTARKQSREDYHKNKLSDYSHSRFCNDCHDGNCHTDTIKCGSDEIVYVNLAEFSWDCGKVC